MPYRTPPILRSLLFFVALALVTVVCNWTAFAPNVVYYSSTSIGPVEFSGEAEIGGRIVFGVAALIVNFVFLSTVVAWMRSIVKRR
jgi:cytochrome c oxidase assembly factor CtaG